MKICEFQKNVVDALNTVEELVKGGCKALAEDTLSIVNDVALQLQTNSGVAIVVTTPRMTRNGCAAGAIRPTRALRSAVSRSRR